jgi:hypothetical protein
MDRHGISDALGMFARPYQTVKTAHLDKELSEFCQRKNRSDCGGHANDHEGWVTRLRVLDLKSI